MKQFIIFLSLFISANLYSQMSDAIKLSDFKLCELTIDDLKKRDPELKQVKLEEMDLCSDGFVQDGRFENRIGYESKLYPGVIFQKYKSDINSIAKIHLTNDFKGFLPDGYYVDLKTLKANDILNKYEELNTWTFKDCSDYWGINKNKQLYFYVKINKEKQPLYPIDGIYYSEQLISGIDIVSDCNAYDEEIAKGTKPLFILDGKEISKEAAEAIKPQNINTVNILKGKKAIDKYGQRGKGGVAEITLKKK